MEAVSLAQARLLAVARGLGRPSQFAEGHSIKPSLAALLPDGSVGRMLTPVEARRLLKLMRYGPTYQRRLDAAQTDRASDFCVLTAPSAARSASQPPMLAILLDGAG